MQQHVWISKHYAEQKKVDTQKLYTVSLYL